MSINVGERIPDATLYLPGDSGPQAINTKEIFSGRKIVVVGMPGAFTPTCHRNHLPGFIENRDAIREKGMDEIVVVTTNETWVMRAWAEATGAKDRIRFISDGNSDFVRKTGLEFDNSHRGMGTRARRFAMIVEDGVVTSLAVEDLPGQTMVSGAASILEKL